MDGGVMQWKQPSDKAIFWALAPITLPLAGFLMVGIFSGLALDRVWNAIARRFAPSEEWHTWFAWRPVQINEWPSPDYKKWAWLEHVERHTDTRFDRRETVYRLIITGDASND